MKTADFHFDLPEYLIAQSPLEERTGSRLLALDGATGSLDHRQFLEIEALLSPNDLLVFNNTRVIPARLYGQKQTGGRVEILIERLRGDGSVLAHVRASKSPKEGSLIFITADQDSDITDFTLRVCGTLIHIILMQAGKDRVIFKKKVEKSSLPTCRHIVKLRSPLLQGI